MKLVIVYLVASVGLAAETVLYQAAAIHTADRGTIENGQLLVQGNRILAVGKIVQAPPELRPLIWGSCNSILG